MKILKNNEKITLNELKEITKNSFGNLVKAVVDIKKKILIIDAELHADMETFLLEQGSLQKDLWGINIYPELTGNDMIEFDSMINLRPSFGNRSRSIDDPKIQEKIIKIVPNFIEK